MKSKIIIFLLSLVIIILVALIIFRGTPLKTTLTPTDQSSSTPNSVTASSSVAIPVASQSTSYAYLFKENKTLTSSIPGLPGYLGYNFFALYIPNWLDANWIVPAPTSSENVDIAPRVRENPDDFSDIVFNLRPSSETLNAVTLYNAEINLIDSSNLINNEVFLNKQPKGDQTMTVYADTYIYHVQESVSGRIKDIYYIDTKDKTLTVTFDARADVFSQFGDKIRNLIQGVAEFGPPQG